VSSNDVRTKFHKNPPLGFKVLGNAHGVITNDVSDSY
jgi:hypothetical protein